MTGLDVGRIWWQRVCIGVGSCILTVQLLQLLGYTPIPADWVARVRSRVVEGHDKVRALFVQVQRPRLQSTKIGRNSPGKNSPVVNAISHILPLRSPDFVCRHAELETLHAVLWPESLPSDRLTWCLLHGMGGVGKTETAIEYAHRHMDKFSAIFWIRAEEESERIKSYCRIGKRVGLVPTDKVGDENDIEKTREWLESTDIRWLLVFDNVEEISDISSLVPSITHGHGSILITSQKSGLGPEQLRGIAIDPFDQQDGSLLLLEHVGHRPGDDVNEADTDLAEEISDLVEGLPLFIATIGGYIKQSKVTLREFIDTFHESSALWAGRGAKAAYRYEKAPGTVFDLALSLLPTKSRELINILAFLSPDVVSDEMLLMDHEDPRLEFLRPINKSSYHDMAYDLRDRNLVKRENTVTRGGFFSIHRTIQQGLLYKLANDPSSREALDQAFQQAFLIVRRASPAPNRLQIPDPNLWHAYEKTLPHIQSLLAAVQSTKLSTTVEFARLLSDAGMDIWERGLHNDGIRLLTAAEGILNDLKLDESLLRANIHIIIALLLGYYGIAARAESRDRLYKALAIRLDYKKHTPVAQYTRDDEVLLYNAWSDYAWALLDCNDYQKAEDIYLRCQAKYTEWGTAEEIPYEYAKVNHHMAFCRIYQGDFDGAIQFAEQGYRWVALATGDDSEISRGFKFDLACVITQQGDITKALAIHEEVLESREQLAGKSNYNTLQSCYAVGALHAQQGNFEQAEYQMRTALERSKKAFWSQAACARAEYHLSKVLISQNKDLTEATELGERAKAVLDELLPLDPLEIWDEADELALYDHLLNDGRFTSRCYLKYVS